MRPTQVVCPRTDIYLSAPSTKFEGPANTRPSCHSPVSHAGVQNPYRPRSPPVLSFPIVPPKNVSSVSPPRELVFLILVRVGHTLRRFVLGGRSGGIPGSR